MIFTVLEGIYTKVLLLQKYCGMGLLFKGKEGKAKVFFAIGIFLSLPSIQYRLVASKNRLATT